MENYTKYKLKAWDELADLLEKRDTCPYAHPSYAPQEAVEKALCSANSPLLLSDSGDNPTAGGIGCNTVLLRLLRELLH